MRTASAHSMVVIKLWGGGWVLHKSTVVLYKHKYKMVKLTKKAKKALAAGQPKAAVAPPAKVVAQAPKAKKASKSEVSPTTAMYLKCLIDPFNEPACRMPDLYGGRTVAFKLMNEYTVTSDGAGYAVFAAHPALLTADMTWTVTAGVTGTAAATQHADYTAVNAAYVWSRLVCFGVEVSYVGAAQTASGGLTSFTFPYSTDLNTQTLSTIYDDGTFSRAQDGAVLVGRPIQEPRFEATSGASTNTPTFPVLAFVGAGLPFTTAVFRVRVTRHMEGLPQKNSLMRGMAADSVADMLALAAGANLGEKGNVSANTPAARQAAKQVASQAASSAITAASPYVAAGAGQLVKWAGEAALGWML